MGSKIDKWGNIIYVPDHLCEEKKAWKWFYLIDKDGHTLAQSCSLSFIANYLDLRRRLKIPLLEYTLSCSDIMSPEEEEEWKRLEEQLSALYDEEEKYDTEYFATTARSKGGADGTSRDATADKGNSAGADEKDGAGSVPRKSECTCGYRGCSIPLKSHSDWCDYRKWREHDDKRKEYEKIRIWF